MNIAITGSTGFIGSAVTEYFRDRENTITRICRSHSALPSNDAMAQWDIPSGKMDISALEGQDAIIHLAGANIAAQRWTARYKNEIRCSRIDGTRLLCRSLCKLRNPPKVLLSASAIGFYGVRSPSDELDELSLAGTDFLSEVCDHWEKATQPAIEVGIRVIHMRFGMVLSTKGGALAKMLPVFKLGLGGKIGSGQQMISWVALDEIPRIMRHLINAENIFGAMNIVSPHAVSNLEFTKALGKIICRLTVFPMPDFIVKLLFGEMGETLLLGGQKVRPKKLIDSGYQFQFSSIEDALIQSIQNK